MAIYLLKNRAAKTAKNTRQLVVAAASLAHARVFAGAYFSGDGSWAEAEGTALASGTLDDASTMTGFIWKLTITGAAAQTGDNATLTAQVTGAASADLDAVAAQLVTALNALPLIANAAYSAPNLTLSSIADGLGDATVNVEVYKDSVSKTNLAALYTGAITHEGIAAAALVLALVADTVVTPAVLAEA
jgi:hypothetical protein